MYTHIQKPNGVSPPNMKTKIVSFVPYKNKCSYKLKKIHKENACCRPTHFYLASKGKIGK